MKAYDFFHMLNFLFFIFSIISSISVPFRHSESLRRYDQYIKSHEQLLDFKCGKHHISTSFLQEITEMISKLQSSSNNTNPAQQSNLTQYIDNHKVWHYTGVLRNPQSGKVIAGIEGLEIVNRLSSEYDSKTKSRIESYVTNKCFIYVDSLNTTQPLLQYRINPIAPKRKLQPIHVINEHIILKIPAINKKLLYSNHRSETRKNMTSSVPLLPSISLAFPGGRTIEMKQLSIQPYHFTTSSSSGSASNKYITSRDRTAASAAATHLLPPVLNNPFNKGIEIRNHVRGYRKRRMINRWLSFASQQQDRTGRSQEYYTIVPLTYIPLLSPAVNTIRRVVSELVSSHRGGYPTHHMKYTRIGESPPWYAVGHTCTIELQGSRYNSYRDAPESITALVETYVPNFRSLSKKGMAGFSDLGDNYDLYKPWYRKMFGFIAK